MDISEILRALEATPVWLRAGLTQVNETQARTAPRDGAWSLADILGHLRASDAILAPRVFHVLIRDKSPLIGFDERAWAALAAQGQMPLITQVDVFAACRAELVAVLRTVNAPDWARLGVHETRGELTLQLIVRDLAQHELEHQVQWNDSLTALGARAQALRASGPPARIPRHSGQRNTG